jgi:hypothetical protein
VISVWAPIFTAFVIAFFAWTLWEARDWWFRARLFPWAIGFTGLPLAVLQFRSELTCLVRSRRAGTEKKVNWESAVASQRTLTMTAWLLGSFAALWLLGFAVAVPLTILFYLKAGAQERWPISIVLAFCGWVLFYGIFGYLLQVPFPDGAVFAWLQLSLAAD